MKKLAQMIVTLFLCALASTTVLTTGAEAHPPKILNYGPFASTSGDSGTCGPDWATDTFKRFFTINTSHPKDVIENFDDGSFVTIAGPSPNACVHLPGPNGNQNTVSKGTTGRFSGSFDIKVLTGTFNPNAKCKPSTCNTTAGFVGTVYGISNPQEGTDYTTGTTFFEFDYYTQKNGAWHNGSTNRGGDQGDITS
ncbi:MAG TPA: hypothetical protein VGL94_23215 [Ktedonobacteraceae bacterium]